MAADGVDKFRIKIWEKVSGTIIYDNDWADSITPVRDVASTVIIKHGLDCARAIPASPTVVTSETVARR